MSGAALVRLASPLRIRWPSQSLLMAVFDDYY
jgi:hypothetical protein